MRLNIGCGDFILPGFINCDLYGGHCDVKCDARQLPFINGAIEEIVAFHVIEHFDFHEAFGVLKEWYRVLVHGGRILIETPDLLKCCTKFVEAEDEPNRIGLYSQFFSMPWIPGQAHKFLYTGNQLRWTLAECGFIDMIERPALRYVGLESICLGMEAYK